MGEAAVGDLRSKTAVLVAMGRALANGDASIPTFSDPTAFALLPESARERVERARSGVTPKGLREAIAHGYLVRQSKIMVARTVAIDDAVRESAPHELVILGAGLDGRAWRMPELSDTVVFEVDHPDSQRDKRARVGTLTQTARDVRFVSVDFARDNLDDALTSAGHDPKRATTWVWEGVVMYLARRDIEATLDVVARRSAPGSRLIVLYHSPAPMLRIVGAIRVCQKSERRCPPRWQRRRRSRSTFGSSPQRASERSARPCFPRDFEAAVKLVGKLHS